MPEKWRTAYSYRIKGIGFAAKAGNLPLSETPNIFEPCHIVSKLARSKQLVYEQCCGSYWKTFLFG
jgi:hypothetical protein